MRKILLTALLLTGGLTASAQYLPNGGFEEWKTECGKSDQTSKNGTFDTKPVGLTVRPGIEPQYWNGSNVNQSVIGQNASNGELVTKVAEGSNTYVKLLNCKVGVYLTPTWFIGDPAPAFINFATPWVYAVTNKKNCDGGVYGGTDFKYRPDAIKGRYKRTEPESKEKAHIIVYLWNGTFTSQIPDNTVSGGKRSQKDVDRAIMGIDKTNVTGDGKLIASCDYTFTSTKDNDWEEIVVPINYALTDEVPTKMNVIISSADYWTRSNIKEGSALDVDDVQFVYYHALKSFTYDGVTTAITDGKYDYTIDQVYDKDKFSCEKIGVGATVEKEFDYDNNILTVTVKGNDFDKNEESKTVYTFKFKGVSFTSDLSVEINGETTKPAPNTIQLIKEADDSYTFQLKNFSLGNMHVGTITLKNLDVNGEKITSSQTIQIEEGDDPTVDSWVGPYLPEVPVNLDATRQGDDLTADINIDMTETLDMVIRVVFAPTVEINGTTDLTQISAGLKNIHFTRSFKAGWNTICVPFNFTTSEYVTSTLADDDEEEDEILMAFDEYRDGKIYFKEVEEIEANVPYLIYYPTEVKDNDIYFGAEVFEPEPRAICSNGFCFQGNYTPSFAMRGRYGVADKGAEGQYILLGGEGSTLPATACFFTSSVGKPQSVMLVVNGETTGIEGIETSNTNDAAVYDLKGIRVSNGSINGLPKGLYIKGGKKVYVK